MAISRLSNITSEISLDEFVCFIDDNIDIDDDDSILSSADMLQSLANNKKFLIEIFNRD